MSALVLGLMALVQAAQEPVWVVMPVNPTVGDTIVLAWVTTLADPSDRLRSERIESSDDIEPLRDPEVSYVSAGVVVRHRVAAFKPGDVTLDMPQLELIAGDGTSRLLPGGSVTLSVGSVLPPGDSVPDPRFSRAPIARRSVSTGPAWFAGAVTLTLVVGWAISRRVTGRRPAWPTTQPRPVNPPIEQWIAAGEPRAVVSLATLRFRERLADMVPQATTAMSIDECLDAVRSERPTWPIREIDDALRALERATFAPAVAADVMGVADEAHEIIKQLEVLAHDEEEVT